MSNNILRVKKDGVYVPIDVNAENVLLKNRDGQYTGENLEDVLRDYHDIVSSAVSGAPKGTYTSLNALQSAYPSGAEGVFLVIENGHWYYWQSTTNTWTDGGVYQSDGLANGSVTLAKLSITLQDFYNTFNDVMTNDNESWEI